MIEIVRANPGCTDAQLAKARERLGHSLPKDYVAFMREHDGVKLAPCEVPDLPPPGASARLIMSLAESRRTLRFVRKPWNVRWPFAEDGCGNYCLLVRGWLGWRVVFFDHETEDLTGLAPSFTAFLRRLQPFDFSSLPSLEGGSVWVNPNPLPPPPPFWDDEDSA